MKAKPLFLLVIVIVIGIFSFQNRQAISLVFFGLNSLSLPLSFWIVLSLFAGIISSLLVQFFSGNNRQTNTYNRPQSPPRSNPNSYSPSGGNPPSIPSQFDNGERTPSRNDYRADRTQEDNLGDRIPINTQNFEYQSSVGDRTVGDKTPANVNEEFFEEDWIDEPVDHDDIRDRNNIYNDRDDRENKEEFDSEKNKNKNDRNSVEVEQEKEKEKSVNSTNQEISDDSEEKTSSDSTNSSTDSAPINEPPAPSLLKKREASLYSYQPRQKEKIETNKDSSDRNESKTSPQPVNQSSKTIRDDQEYENDTYEDEYDDDRRIPINIPPRKKRAGQSPNRNRSPRRKRNDVYDASYRVITPSRKNDRITQDDRYDRNYEPDDDFDWDEDEDWDF